MNLVVIVLDTLRYDCVHHKPAPGIARVETPNPVVLDMTEPRATVVNVSGTVRPGN